MLLLRLQSALIPYARPFDTSSVGDPLPFIISLIATSRHRALPAGITQARTKATLLLLLS